MPDSHREQKSRSEPTISSNSISHKWLQQVCNAACYTNHFPNIFSELSSGIRGQPNFRIHATSRPPAHGARVVFTATMPAVYASSELLMARMLLGLKPSPTEQQEDSVQDDERNVVRCEYLIAFLEAAVALAKDDAGDECSDAANHAHQAASRKVA
eukprot:3606191-Prorocentrum_lima.AAC.1